MKSTPPPRQFPRQNQKGGAGGTRSGDLFPPLPLRPEQGDTMLVLSRLFLHFLPPFPPFCFLSLAVFLFFQCLSSFSISSVSVSPRHPLSLLPNHSPSFPPAFRPRGGAGAGGVCPCGTKSASSHVSVREFLSALHPPFGGLGAVVRAGVRLSVCLPAG